MDIYYAGIGARKTPKNILELMSNIGEHYAKCGFILRSGGADGADKAFEIGCDRVNGKKEIYLPWKGFNGSTSEFILSSNEAYKIASEFHPSWDYLKSSVKGLHARNTHQILGSDLKTPSKFVVCWTEKGLDIGGTAQAIRLARGSGIKVFNIGAYENLRDFKLDLLNYTNSLELS